MLTEVKAIEPTLKQILYGCVEHVQATKAALFISASNDLNDKIYELVTSYQYNDASRRIVKGTDDLVDRLAVKRNAFFINGLGADQRFSEILFRQGTDRLLVTPLFARGRLVGFIDMRDKAGRKPFDTPDIEAARKIADEVLAVLGAKNLFGVGPIALADAPQRVTSSNIDAQYLATSMPSAVVAASPHELSRQAMKTIEQAREILAKRQLAAGASKRVLTDHDLEVVRLLLPAAIAIPGAVLACFSAAGHINNPQAIVAIATVTEDALDLLQDHLRAWLKKTHQPEITTRPQVVYPFGVQVVPVSAAGISTILSAPVNAQSVEGLVLTVAFERTPEAQAQRAMHIFLRQIEHSVESAIAATSGRNDRQLIAEKLLEPDFQKYPELLDHSRQVSAMAQRLAIAMELPPPQVETVRLAGFVHDVGLRLLDYDRLYKRPNLTAEEMRGLAEHPIVGAALVEPLLGNDVSQAVLRHHERVDGRGYPSRMTGQAIPIASRIIQVCDAWIAMTSPNSYQPPISRDQAANKLREGAGSQFDETVVATFIRSLAQIGA
ncbi:MAG TPA: HD domain-containing phosphohydrolase [Thermoanaerobaculia bacterium]|nr:HD domain-containing phosphohydrolase [Thermoanaerobaculia bacterium]